MVRKNKKLAAFKKTLEHPIANTIIKKLSKGESVRDVEKFLVEAYPNDKKLHISYITLQKFRKEHLGIEGEAISMIKDVQNEKEGRKLQSKIRAFPSYKEKLKEALDANINIKQELANMNALISSRLEEIFDRISMGAGLKDDEINLQKYLSTYMVMLEKWAKYIDGIADYRIETNINISSIETQMGLLRESVWEILGELDQSLAIKFLERLDAKIKTLDFNGNKKFSINGMNNEVNVLSASIEAIENNRDDTDE